MHLFLTIGQGFVLHNTLGNGKQGIIRTNFDIRTRLDLGAALAYQDIARKYCFTGEFFTPSRWALLSRPFRLEPPPFYVPLPLLHFD